jgi:predicted esterase
MEVGFGRRAREQLEAAGFEVTYRESDLGHQIDPAGLAAATEWLGRVL